MLIGLRFLLIFAVLAASASFLAWAFTKNPRFLQTTKTIIKVAVIGIACVGLLIVAERLLIAL